LNEEVYKQYQDKIKHKNSKIKGLVNLVKRLMQNNFCKWNDSKLFWCPSTDKDMISVDVAGTIQKRLRMTKAEYCILKEVEHNQFPLLPRAYLAPEYVDSTRDLPCSQRIGGKSYPYLSYDLNNLLYYDPGPEYD
jgi:hypothetical protein